MLDEINAKIQSAKFVGDLKKVVAELAAVVYQRIIRLETVAIEHAKLLDPKAFNEEPPAPAEAATDAPTDEATREPGDRSQEDASPPADETKVPDEPPVKLKRKKDAPPPPAS